MTHSSFPLLADLLSPLAPQTFLKEAWPNEPVFLPAAPSKLAELLSLPVLQSLERLVACRTSKVRACLPDFDDEYSSVLVDAKDALKMHRCNMTLVFDGMQDQEPVILAHLNQLKAELGLGQLTQSRAIAYATPAGGQTRLHFDANVNFVIQLSGSKRWRLAPNESVENPTDRFTSCTGDISSDLEAQCHAPLLEEMPDGATEYVMERGCVLVVPRGYWHETATDEDALSLNFTFSQPTRADVFARALHTKLSESPVWRSLAQSAADDEKLAQSVSMDLISKVVKVNKSAR